MSRLASALFPLEIASPSALRCRFEDPALRSSQLPPSAGGDVKNKIITEQTVGVLHLEKVNARIGQTLEGDLDPIVFAESDRGINLPPVDDCVSVLLQVLTADCHRF